MYKIREAKVADFFMIVTINDDPNHLHLNSDAPIANEYFHDVIIAKDSKIYVVEKSGEMIAFILFYVNEGEQSVSIERFSIDNFYRDKGIDEHLYHKVERLAQAKGMKQIVTFIEGDNPSVYDFFERKGWQQGDQENQYYLILK